VVVRLYEAHGTRARGTVTASFTVTAVTETDLLEQDVPLSSVQDTDGPTVTLELRPFQLVTLRFARTG